MNKIRVRFYTETREDATALAGAIRAAGWEINEDESGSRDLAVDICPTQGKTMCGGLEELGLDLLKSGYVN